MLGLPLIILSPPVAMISPCPSYAHGHYWLGIGRFHPVPVAISDLCFARLCCRTRVAGSYRYWTLAPLAGSPVHRTVECYKVSLNSPRMMCRPQAIEAATKLGFWPILISTGPLGVVTTRTAFGRIESS